MDPYLAHVAHCMFSNQWPINTCHHCCQIGYQTSDDDDIVNIWTWHFNSPYNKEGKQTGLILSVVWNCQIHPDTCSCLVLIVLSILHKSPIGYQHTDGGEHERACSLKAWWVWVLKHYFFKHTFPFHTVKKLCQYKASISSLAPYMCTPITTTNQPA